MIALSCFAQSASDEEQLRGTWKAPEINNSLIKIYKSDEGFWLGEILQSDQSEDIGKVFLRKGKYDPKTKIWSGELVNPDNGIVLTAELTLTNNSTLKVKGTKFFITKTMNWIREE